ncbi:hypothetical protein [Micrococcus terreus]|uniref:hypothetical protein n=1 Tax=Micrococcus terreus TaxID=574650 RepID=UPI0030172A74
MTNDYATTWDALAEAIGAAQGHSSGSITDMDHLTVDQRLKAAEVAALLSIAQEISALNPQNTTTRDEDGSVRNGWGTVISSGEPKKRQPTRQMNRA